jgi:antitoxin VapB
MAYPNRGVMEKSTVFMSSRSQAVRLPKAVALPVDVKKVDIVAVGRTRIISPEGESWDSWFNGLQVTGDFMEDRNQPKAQERDSL